MGVVGYLPRNPAWGLENEKISCQGFYRILHTLILNVIMELNETAIFNSQFPSSNVGGGDVRDPFCIR